ncbi:MAG: PaaI family thioesterase [Bryobacteraceae bacterium]
MLERLQKDAREGHPDIPLAETMGFQVTEVRRGEAVVEMEAGPEHANPSGTLHGGVLCTIADTAMGVAHASMLSAEETFTTLELKINFLRPFWTGKLRAIGKVVKSGRTISLVECDVLDEAGKLVARASSTCMTLRGEQAEGRHFAGRFSTAG